MGYKRGERRVVDTRAFMKGDPVLLHEDGFFTEV